LQLGAARLRRRFRNEAVDHGASYRTKKSKNAARSLGGFALKLQAITVFAGPLPDRALAFSADGQPYAKGMEHLLWEPFLPENVPQSLKKLN